MYILKSNLYNVKIRQFLWTIKWVCKIVSGCFKPGSCDVATLKSPPPLEINTNKYLLHSSVNAVLVIPRKNTEIRFNLVWWENH